MPIVALDAGGGTLKASLLNTSSPSSSPIKPWTLTNHVGSVSGAAAMLMGQDLAQKERQRTKLRYMRPVERGYCVNWNVETDIFAHLFSPKMMDVNPRESSLLITAPLFSPTVLHETMDQVVFEEFGFQAYARVHAAEMCVLSYDTFIQQSNRQQSSPVRRSPKRTKKKTIESPESISANGSMSGHPSLSSSCYLVVDSGFSFTHIIPVIDGSVYLPAVKRVNVGGKLLTNYLKEIISYRQWNVMDDTPMVNELKESICYCSMDFAGEMKKYQVKESRKHWILPDFVHSFHGQLRSPEKESANETEDQQTLEMGVEMITVPEVLFNPSDIGINQAGIAEAILQAVGACSEDFHSALFANILLVGGNSKFVNFKERLMLDLRPLVPMEYDIDLHHPTDPTLSALEGCISFASSALFGQRMVTKQEYDEHGSNVCFKRF